MDTKLTRRTLLLAAGAATAAPLLPAVAPAEPMVSAADTIHVTMTAAATRPLGMLVDIQHDGIISFMGFDQDGKHIRVDVDGNGTRKTVELPPEFQAKSTGMTLYASGKPFRLFGITTSTVECSDSSLSCNMLRIPRSCVYRDLVPLNRAVNKIGAGTMEAIEKAINPTL